MANLPFEYAARNLGRSFGRLVMSVGGAALVALLAMVAGGVVKGMRGALLASGGDGNVILLGAGSEESVERSEIDAAVPGLLAAGVPGIRTRAGVAYVSPEVHAMLPLEMPGVGSQRASGDRTDAGTGPASARLATLRGVTPAASLVHDSVALIDGRWPRAGLGELLVGRMVPAALGVPDAALAIGERVVLDGRPWTVVGRLAARTPSRGGSVAEGQVWLPLSDLQILTRREGLSCVVVTLDPFDEATGGGAEFDDIAVFTKTRPDLELVAMTERDYYARLAAFLGPIEIVTWITAGLVALGALLGGLNTTYAAFASRGRELGMLQALGFRRRAILRSMVEESTLASAAGGVMACAVGILLLDGLAVRYSLGAFGLAIDARVAGLGLLIGIALGAVGALPPALRWLRPTIPEALKGG